MKSILAQNEVALKLYRGVRFIEEGRQVRAVRRGPGVYDDVVCMALDIR